MIALYSKSNCPACVQAKAILDSHGIQYKTIMIDDPDNASAREWLLKQGHRSVPQLYKGGNLYCEGLPGLKELQSIGQLS